TNNASTRKKKSCKACINCASNCFAIALISITIWLLLFKTVSPTLSIEEFDLFALHRVTNNFSRYKNIFQYDLKLQNNKNNFNKGIYYDALDLSFNYKPNLNMFIGNATISSFYQGHQKATHRVGDINIVTRGVRWENATVPLVFRVELATKVRYKNMIWKTKRHHLVVGVDFKVNDQGRLLKGKDNMGMKLISKGERNNKGCFELLGIFSILIFIHSL
ncbi:protein NDR1-like, partial [Chenopodium quinoa]|uniref:protein NDR1-like n=1 Tax=Chenopodium quinoa TaxID=63459 RepID=UPI000B793F2A